MQRIHAILKDEVHYIVIDLGLKTFCYQLYIFFMFAEINISYIHVVAPGIDEERLHLKALELSTFTFLSQ